MPHKLLPFAIPIMQKASASSERIW
jgi:hypothetical protein